jgi:hypothetical protein
LTVYFLQLEREISLRFQFENQTQTHANYIKKLESQLIVSVEKAGVADKIKKLIDKIQDLKVFICFQLFRSWNFFSNIECEE